RARRRGAGAVRHDRQGGRRVRQACRAGGGDRDAPRGDRASPRLGRGRTARAPVRLAGERSASDLRAARQQARRHSFFLRALPREVLAPRVRLRRDTDPALAPKGGPDACAGRGPEGPAVRRPGRGRGRGRNEVIVMVVLVLLGGALVLLASPRHRAFYLGGRAAPPPDTGGVSAISPVAALSPDRRVPRPDAGGRIVVPVADRVPPELPAEGIPAGWGLREFAGRASVELVRAEAGMARQRQRRNVAADYVALFGRQPPRVGQVAVMIDSDDTGSDAEALIGDLVFSRATTESVGISTSMLR